MRDFLKNILGEDFSITDFNVVSPKDLVEVLKLQHRDLDDRIYLTKDGEYVSPIELPKDCSVYNKCLFTLIDELCIGGYFDTQRKAIAYYGLLKQRLKFMVTPENKIDFLQNELLSIEKDFSQNKYNEVLSPDNYFNELRSLDFFANLWTVFHRSNRSLVNNFIRNHHNYSYYPEELLNNIGTKNEFEELMEILQKFTLIKYEIFIQENKILSVKSPILENKYPSIFTDGNSMKLFNYIIENEEKKIGRAYITKYFNLFKDENRIRRNAKISSFLRFLKSNHQIEFEKLDNRTTYSEEERDKLASLENAFKKYTLSN